MSNTSEIGTPSALALSRLTLAARAVRHAKTCTDRADRGILFRFGDERLGNPREFLKISAARVLHLHENPPVAPSPRMEGALNARISASGIFANSRNALANQALTWSCFPFRSFQC